MTGVTRPPNQNLVPTPLNKYSDDAPSCYRVKKRITIRLYNIVVADPENAKGGGGIL